MTPGTPDWRCLECDHPRSMHNGRKCAGLIDSGFTHEAMNNIIYFECDCTLTDKAVEQAFRARFT